MVFMRILLTAVFLLGFAGFSCAKKTEDSKTSSTLQYKTIRSAICSNGAFNEKRDRSCVVPGDPDKQPLYRFQRHILCKVELWKERPSKTCPGYKPPAIFKNFIETSCGGTLQGYHTDCGVGNRQISVDVRNEECWARGQFLRRRVGSVTCETPEIIKSCRFEGDPKVDAELYYNCRAETGDPDDVELYPSCAREEFGLKEEECQVLMLPEEVVDFISKTSRDLSTKVLDLIDAQVTAAREKNGKKGYACMINDLSNQPFAEDQVELLKRNFTEIFDAPFNPSEYDCSSRHLSDNINCDDSNSSTYCTYKNKEKELLQWLADAQSQTQALIDDIVARKNPKIRMDLQSLNEKLAKGLDLKTKIDIPAGWRKNQDGTFMDISSGLTWSPSDGNLIYGSHRSCKLGDPWRLPTKEELENAYKNGIFKLTEEGRLNLRDGLLWSSTFSPPRYVYAVDVQHGSVFSRGDNDSAYVVCVRS